MPILRATEAPQFQMHAATFTGLAAPSRGSTETSVWQTSIPAGTKGVEHQLDREEVLVLLKGAAVVTLDGVAAEVEAGDTVVVPAGCRISVSTGQEPLTMLAVLPVGGQAVVPGQPPFTPPWAK